jgi:hypothetical protein
VCVRIIAALSSEERGLFKEQIRYLDKKIHPGLTKLTWASKGISDYFIGECRGHARKVTHTSITSFIFMNHYLFNTIISTCYCVIGAGSRGQLQGCQHEHLTDL